MPRAICAPFSTRSWVHENEAWWPGRWWPSEPIHSITSSSDPGFPTAVISVPRTLPVMKQIVNQRFVEWICSWMSGDRSLGTLNIKGNKEKLRRKGQTGGWETTIDQCLRTWPWVFITLCSTFLGFASGKTLFIWVLFCLPNCVVMETTEWLMHNHNISI